MKKSRLKDYILEKNTPFYIINLNCLATLEMLNRNSIYVRALNAESAAHKCEQILERSLGFKENSFDLHAGDVEEL